MDKELPLITYLKEHKDLEEMGEELSEIDCLILTVLSYTKFESLDEHVKPPLTIKEYANYYPPDENSKGGKYVAFLGLLARNKRYRDIKIIDFKKSTSVEEEKQFAYMALRLPNKHIFASFRGTDATIVGWKEDLNMAFLDAVPAQKEALETLDDLMNKHPFSKFYLGGHSKGGALAIYAYSKLSKNKQKRIISVTDLDSPGLKDDEMGDAEIAKIHTFVPRAAIVGLIYRKKQRVSVVSSTNKNIMQHDAFSWEIEGNKLKRLDEFDTGLKLEESRFNKILDNLSPWEAEYLVNTIYKLINEYDVKYVDDILSVKMIVKILAKVRILDSDHFLVLKDLVKRIFKKDE